ncbi:MAG: hypothetical protein KGZ83_04565 [Sulfuricella sp.]|nr:hypothetical protein [Sulfuricella sp.]
MSINSVSSGSSKMVAASPQPEKNEVKRAGREVKVDGDADDAKSKASIGPSVNTSGQTIGSIINVTA